MEVLNYIQVCLSSLELKKKQHFRGPITVVQISYWKLNNGTLISLQVTLYKSMAMHILFH